MSIKLKPEHRTNKNGKKSKQAKVRPMAFESKAV